ncbi:MAG: PilN domain-containing protein [Nitrospirota bacterium]
MRQHINLLIAEGERGEGTDYKGPAIIIALFAPIIILLLAYGFEKRETVTLKKELANLTSKRDAIKMEIARLTGGIEATVSRREVVRVEEEKRLDLIKRLVRERILWSEVMRELSLTVPEEVWLTDLESRNSKRADRKEVRLVGLAGSHLDLTRFITLLEGSNYFSDISLIYAQKGEDPSGKVNFEVTGLVEMKGL